MDFVCHNLIGQYYQVDPAGGLNNFLLSGFSDTLLYLNFINLFIKGVFEDENNL